MVTCLPYHPLLPPALLPRVYAYYLATTPPLYLPTFTRLNLLVLVLYSLLYCLPHLPHPGGWTGCLCPHCVSSLACQCQVLCHSLRPACLPSSCMGRLLPHDLYGEEGEETLPPHLRMMGPVLCGPLLPSQAHLTAPPCLLYACDIITLPHTLPCPLAPIRVVLVVPCPHAFPLAACTLCLLCLPFLVHSPLPLPVAWCQPCLHASLSFSHLPSYFIPPALPVSLLPFPLLRVWTSFLYYYILCLPLQQPFLPFTGSACLFFFPTPFIPIHCAMPTLLTALLEEGDYISPCLLPGPACLPVYHPAFTCLPFAIVCHFTGC